MTAAEFKEKWKIRLAGLSLYGLVIDATQGPLAKATHAMEVPGKVEALIQEMWLDLNPPPPTKVVSEPTPQTKPAATVPPVSPNPPARQPGGSPPPRR